MEPERRRTRRTTPAELSYLQFEPGGGGIVLNASEEGLAFHAAAAVNLLGPIRLCLSPHPGQRIKLNAEIVWMDDRRKSGGLHLKEVPAETREQIRQWLSPSLGLHTEHSDFLPPSKVVDPLDGMSPFAGSESHDTFPSLPAAAVGATARTAAAAIAAPRVARAPTSSLFLEPLSGEDAHGLSRPRWLRGFATAFLALILVSMPILLVQNFRLEVGNALIRMGEKLKSAGDTQPEPSFPSTPSTPPQSEIPSSGEESSSPAADIKDSATQVPAPAEAAAAAPTEPEKVIREKASPKGRLASALPSQKVHPKPPRGASASQLWSAVEAGDTQAEVALAGLYLKGEGVPRNCEQARVLLEAASKKGDAEALRQYRELSSSGCSSR